jgi:hypothetical protein
VGHGCFCYFPKSGPNSPHHRLSAQDFLRGSRVEKVDFFIAVPFFTCSVWYLSHTLIVLFKKQIGNLNTGQLDTIVDSQLLCDRWPASSALQKSTRRGDDELAQRAACTLLRFRSEYSLAAPDSRAFSPHSERAAAHGWPLDRKCVWARIRCAEEVPMAAKSGRTPPGQVQLCPSAEYRCAYWTWYPQCPPAVLMRMSWYIRCHRCGAG